jgi:hypothetical protein
VRRTQHGAATSSPAKKKKFLKALEDGGMVASAAKKVGVDRATVYRGRHRDAEFDDAWTAIYDTGTDELEAKAMEKALAGDSVMLQFMLKARSRTSTASASRSTTTARGRRKRELDAAPEENSTSSPASTTTWSRCGRPREPHRGLVSYGRVKRRSSGRSGGGRRITRSTPARLRT